MTNQKELTLNTLESRLGLELPTPENTMTPDWDNIDKYKLYVKRDDLIHRDISGNKWRKLKHQLMDFIQNEKKQHIISFGGGHSNHIHALAHCCNKLSIKMTAIIRGNYESQPTPMLQDIKRLNTQIKYVTKVEYKKRSDKDYLHKLQELCPNALIIPEGGSHQLAIPGLTELAQEFVRNYDVVVCPVASAGTIAGLVSACNNGVEIHGIAMLKGERYLEEETSTLLSNEKKRGNWCIHHNFHCGGYAKCPDYLQAFCREFSYQTQIPVEPVYSGKMFYALKQLIQQRYFKKGAKILALHTGGLQGNRVKY